ncbi:hypothetical protein RND81_02G189200 [Saponaria officinalis]|uniref:Uncharacterized protein n=1 Tax=Saponaria officinalis TaxID=3572 RepID=A0AAW1MVY3_SAPOF
MSGKFPNLSWWLWSGKKKDAKKSQNKSSLKPSSKSNDLELDFYKDPAVGGVNSKRVRRKGRNREGGKIDKEYGSVVVPFDGVGSSSDSESDGSDWSIGWSEPHAPGFLSEDEIDSGFGVLVRCYGRTYATKTDVSKKSPHDANVYKADNQKHIDRWLSTLQGGS